MFSLPAQVLLRPPTFGSIVGPRKMWISMSWMIRWTSGRDSYGPWFSVAVKRVQNGSLEKVVTWRFFKPERIWQYATSTMASGRRAGVIVPNKIFEYGMNQLGWSYSNDGMHYY